MTHIICARGTAGPEREARELMVRKAFMVIDSQGFRTSEHPEIASQELGETAPSPAYLGGLPGDIYWGTWDRLGCISLWAWTTPS